MKIVLRILFVLLFLLPNLTLAASTVYKDCSTVSQSSDICYGVGDEKHKGDSYIDSGTENNYFWAYTFSNGQFKALHMLNGKEIANIWVHPSGLVGRNLKFDEYYPSNKNINNTIPELRAAFLGSADWKRKAVQRNL